MSKIRYIKFTDTAYNEHRSVWINPACVVTVLEHPQCEGTIISTTFGDSYAVREDPSDVFEKLGAEYD